MRKYYGMIGYGVDTETEVPGVWNVTDIVERPHYGNVLSNIRDLRQQSDSINDDIKINNSISIVADPYAFEHFQNIRYATWMGTKWRVVSIDVQYPRLILTLGGEYNGQ